MAVRLLAKVLMRMPNQATETLPIIPTRLKRRMMASCPSGPRWQSR